jgi:hypothetical protein
VYFTLREYARWQGIFPIDSSYNPAVEEDDGIIDLQALSRPGREVQRAIAAPVFTPSETPPAAFAVDAERAARPRGSTGKVIALIAGGLVFVGLAGFGLRTIFRGEEPVSRFAPPPPPPAPPPPPVAAAPPPAPSADPPPVADEDPPPAKKAKKKGFAGGGVVRPAVRPPVTPKAADPCGCKGNFDCNLRCAAGSK